MNTWFAVLLISICAALLTGCGVINDGSQSTSSSFDVRLPDNRMVTCVQIGGYGITCDWAGAK